MSREAILLTTEATYPCYTGGVSHWCDQLIRGLPRQQFDLLAITDSPHRRPVRTLPANIRNYTALPLWGTEEAGWQEPLLSTVIQRRLADGGAPRLQFFESFERTVLAILKPGAPSEDLAEGMCALWHYFRGHDYTHTMTSLPVWDHFRRLLVGHFPGGEGFTLAETTDCMRWLLRNLAITSVPLGEVGIVHSSMAGLAGVPGVLHKLIRGVPFVITEHGVYLREVYLSLAQSPYSDPCRRFLLMLADALVRMNYRYADTVTSLCEYNRRWQAELGGDRLIEPTPNGADPAIFFPRSHGGEPSKPVVVTLARIFRLKGVDVLLKAAARVKESVPGVKFRVLGEVADADYFAECCAIVRAHHLEDVVEFGQTDQPAEAMRQATVACLPSISEAFPFALVEAMLCSCPIVASDVGGIPEILGGTGVTFKSGADDQLAAALIYVLEPSARGLARRAAFGKAARERALANYTISGSIQHFKRLYRALKERNSHAQPLTGQRTARASA